MGGVGEIPEHLARAGARSGHGEQSGSTQPPPEIRERVATEQAKTGSTKVPRSIDSHHMMEAVKADTGGQGPGLVVVVTHASGRERTEVLRTTEVSIGRDRNNELVLTGDGISRRHALLTLGQDNSCTIIDLGSTNGTFVNEQPIENSPTELTQKDFVTLGEFALRVRPFGEEANVDPSTMQFDVPAAAVIVQNAEPAPYAAQPEPRSPEPRTQPPPPRPRTAPPPAAGRQNAQGEGLSFGAGTQPAPDSNSPPAASPPQPAAKQMKTAQMSADDFESEQGQGTMAMLDTSLLEQADQAVSHTNLGGQREPIAPPIATSGRAPIAPPVGGRAPIAPPVASAARAAIAPPVASAARAPIAPPVASATRAPIAPPVASAARAPIAPPVASAARAPIAPPVASAAREPIAPPVRMPEAVEAEPLDIMNEMTVSEQQTRVQELADLPPPALSGELEASSVRPPGVVVAAGSAPPLPPEPSSVRRPRASVGPGTGLPQTGPRSRPIGEPSSKTPIGMPAPPARPPAVVAPQQAQAATAGRVTQESERPVSRPPPAPKSSRSKPPPSKAPRSAPPARKSAPAAADEPSTGPDSIVVAGRVTTDSSAALEALLSDPDVTRVSVQVRRVDVERRGTRSHHDGFDFATEDGLARAIARICERGGVTLDASALYTRGTLSDGWELFIARPPAAPNGQLVQLRRVSTIVRSLDDVTKEGWLSKPMAALLERCLEARCNVLMVSERDDDAETMAGALSSTSDVPALWVVRDAAVAPKGYPAIVLDIDAPGATLDACAELAVDRVMMPRMRLDAWHALLRIVRRGRDGVVARLRGPSIHAALDRTAAGLAAYVGEQQQMSTKIAASVPTFRAWLSASFTLALEIGRIRDGAPRVLRLTELSAASAVDLYEFNPDPAPHGTFNKVGEPEDSKRILTARGF